MKITKQARRAAKDLFRSAQINGVLDDQRAREAVRRVATEKPRGYLATLSHFERLVKLDIARRTARVESAIPLSPALQTSVRENLAQTYGQGLNVSFGQNPALLGGMRIQVGSDVYDGSVAARLAALQEHF
jgi:F-type H+-transporting ATPase subunit delta